MKTDSFGNFNLLDKLFTKIANKQNTTHRFSTEWRVFIIIALIVGVITSIISVYSGRPFLFGFINPFYENKGISQVTTLTILILIELLTYYSMSKAWKFFLKWDALKFLPTAIFTIMIYSLSFYQSTSGLSIQESNKVDLSETINDNLDVEIQNLKADLKEQTAYYKSEIATIKANPSGWSGGKRTILTSNQLSDIKTYNNTILELKQDTRKQVKELESNAKLDKKNNLAEITSTREKYFGFISIVMTIQILCSGFLGFAWSQIQSENAPEDFAKSKVLDITMQVDSSINALWQDRLNSLQHGLSIALNSNAAAGVPLEISTPLINENEEVQTAEILNKQNIGFKMQHKAQTGTNTKLRTCEHCNKEFIYKTYNQRFCSSACRIEKWQQKTGVKVKFKKKK